MSDNLDKMLNDAAKQFGQKHKSDVEKLNKSKFEQQQEHERGLQLLEDAIKVFEQINQTIQSAGGNSETDTTDDKNNELETAWLSVKSATGLPKRLTLKLYENGKLVFVSSPHGGGIETPLHTRTIEAIKQQILDWMKEV